MVLIIRTAYQPDDRLYYDRPYELGDDAEHHYSQLIGYKKLFYQQHDIIPALYLYSVGVNLIDRLKPDWFMQKSNTKLAGAKPKTFDNNICYHVVIECSRSV